MDGAKPNFLADPDQLGRMCGNIILNAVQATPDSGRLAVKGKVSGGDSPSGGGWVATSFTDTGLGIPDDNLDRIFDPLFTTKAKGIGLGLALVKTLVEGHGGTINVESGVGEGSAFTVRLPMVG